MLLQQVKKIPGVTQAVLFGNQIHICGTEEKVVEHGLNQMISASSCLTYCTKIPTLEDAFIELVKQPQGELS